MNALPPESATVSFALAHAIVDYLQDRSERKTKRLLLHRYPRSWLERTCEHLVDITSDDRGVPCVAGKPLELALIQPPSENNALKEYKGFTYGSAPDWPVQARDRGGLLLVLCPPEWYEFLHESIRSNSFLAFDEGRNGGAPKDLLGRMVAGAGLTETDDRILSISSTVLLEAAQDRRHDDGAAQFLGWLENYLGDDPILSPASMRKLGLIPDDLVLLSSSETEITRRILDNLEYQVKLSTELGRAPLRYFHEHYPDEQDSIIAEQLREHTAKFHYNLSLDDLGWREEWPTDLTLKRVRGGQDQSSTTGNAVTLHGLHPAGSVDSFEGIPVIHDPDVEVAWDYAGAEETGGEDVTGYLDSTQLTNSMTRLEHGNLSIPSVSPGIHVLEIRAVDPNRLVIRGQNRCEFFVARNGVIPFAVRGQSAHGERFDVIVGRPFTVVWGPSERNADIARWVLHWQGVSGAEGTEVIDSFRREFFMPNGIVERTDFHLAAISSHGEQIASAALVSAPAEEANSDAATAGSVAQALLNAAGELRRDSNWSHLRERNLKVSVEERSETQYWIRIYDEDEVVLQRRYRIQASRLLDRFERLFLDDATVPWLRVTPAQGGPSSVDVWPVETADTIEMGRWQQVLKESAEVKTFLEARRRLFERMTSILASGESVIGGLSLTVLADEIRAYAFAYDAALGAIVRDDVEFQPHHVLLALTDTVLLIAGTWSGSHELPGSGSQVSAMAVSPTHPLRILWLLQLELAVKEAIENPSNLDFNPDSFEGLSGLNYPPYLLDFERKFYRNVGVSTNQGWALYLPEQETESDAALSPRIQRELPLRTTADNVAVTSQQIQNALAYYHEAHPFRDTIRFHYINAGSGEKIVEALKGWMDRYFATSPSRAPDVRVVTAGRMRFRVNLLDLYDTESHAGIGRAFDEYAEETDALDQLLSRTLFSVQPLKRQQFEHVRENVPVERNHIMFGSDIFDTRGDAHRVEGRAFSLAAWGLRNAPTKFIEGSEEPHLFLSALVPEAREGSKDDSPLEKGRYLLHSLVYRFQVMSSVTDQTKPYHSDTARMQVIQIDRGAMGAIQRMHEVADWVYIADAHIDVELFDRPDQDGRYILDYTPTIGATGRKDARHNYVVTTSDATQIAASIQRFLQNEYASTLPGIGDTNEVAVTLLRTLNRLSGRVLLHVLGRPTAVKGIVGMALVHDQAAGCAMRCSWR